MQTGSGRRLTGRARVGLRVWRPRAALTPGRFPLPRPCPHIGTGDAASGHRTLLSIPQLGVGLGSHSAPQLSRTGFRVCVRARVFLHQASPQVPSQRDSGLLSRLLGAGVGAPLLLSWDPVLGGGSSLMGSWAWVPSPAVSLAGAAAAGAVDPGLGIPGAGCPPRPYVREPVLETPRVRGHIQAPEGALLQLT